MMASILSQIMLDNRPSALPHLLKAFATDSASVKAAASCERLSSEGVTCTCHELYKYIIQEKRYGYRSILSRLIDLSSHVLNLPQSVSCAPFTVSSVPRPECQGGQPGPVMEGHQGMGMGTSN